MFSLHKNIRLKTVIYIDVQSHLFDFVVIPVLLHGCEIWGFEKSIFKIFKNTLRLKKMYPLCMICRAIGILQIEFRIKTRMIKFWVKLIDTNSNVVTHNL